MTFEYKNGMAIDEQHDTEVMSSAAPARDMEPHGYNSPWGRFKNKEICFYIPYYYFNCELRSGDPYSQFARYIFLRKTIFRSFIASTLSDGKIPDLSLNYKLLLQRIPLLDERSPAYLVFERKEFIEFYENEIPSSIIESQFMKFNQIFLSFVEAMELLSTNGGRLSASILKRELITLDLDVTFEDLRAEFFRDSTYLAANLGV